MNAGLHSNQSKKQQETRTVHRRGHVAEHGVQHRDEQDGRGEHEEGMDDGPEPGLGEERHLADLEGPENGLCGCAGSRMRGSVCLHPATPRLLSLSMNQTCFDVPDLLPLMGWVTFWGRGEQIKGPNVQKVPSVPH